MLERGRVLALVFAATALTLGLGYLVKAPCASGDWRDGRQYRRLCYSDIVPLYATEQLDRGKVPYLDARNEYPVLTGVTMWVASLPADDFASFFNANVVILAGAAFATAWALWRLVERRALYFALAPTLLIYGFVNWDLVAVALATLATLAYVRARRPVGAGALLGLGAAAKLYPGLLALPFAAGPRRAGRARDAVRLAGAAALAWAVVNAPFAVAAGDRWSYFFRFNSRRAADWDTAWFLLDHHGVRLSTATVNAASLAAFVGLAGLLWIWKTRRDPGFPAWTFGFPLLVAFLITNKVYSPQYGLWLLPWFALTLPNLRLFAAFEAADIAVFVTRFRFFDELPREGLNGAWHQGFEVALAVRGLILVACLVAWVLRREGRAPEPDAALRPVEAAA